mgnify:CR=1 FL=1|jgi:ABC-type nickel/cobalt efflux system permease component RcnA
MEELKSKASDLADHVGGLLDTYYQLALVNVTKKSSTVATLAITLLFIGVFSVCVLVFIGVGLVVWLSTMMSMTAACFIVAAFYMVLIVALWLLRRKLILPAVRELLVRKIYG